MQCWTHYKHYSIGTAGTNDYLWESKYHWTIFGHDHGNSLFEGLTIDLIQPFISHWIRPVRGPILMILLYDLSPYPPYPEIPWLSVDLTRAQGICYLECEHPKNPRITEYVAWSLMLWCWSVWITRNRANPGNGIVDSYWGPGTGPWCFESLIHGNREPEQPNQTVMPHLRMLPICTLRLAEATE